MFRQKLLSMVLLAGMLLGLTVPAAHAAALCDQAQFVSDITVPDGAAFAPGASFTKTWRFMNAGSCTWTTAYRLVYAGGDAMGTVNSVKLPVNVPPGQMLDISVTLTAPATPGHYKSLWKFANASGVPFGIGASGNDAFWVDINVIAVNAVIYDFVANAPYALWKSGAGTLPFPGASGDNRGFAYQVDRPHLEDDSYDSLPGLLVVPQNKYNGYIQATYPEFQVQKGDQLQTLVNCEFGAAGCYVTFRIDYLSSNGRQKTLWSWKEAHDKRFYRASLDLSPLAGQKVRFVFLLLSSGLASGDRAIWGSPRIVRVGTGQPPLPPATLTPLPPLTPTPTPFTSPPPTLAPAGCDRAAFVADVNIPDGTTFAPGAVFSKTWRLKNIGSCVWTKDYRLTYYSGELMNAQVTVPMPYSVSPGKTVDVTVNMVAPSVPGKYRGYWILANAGGKLFGFGADASKPFWVEINVAGNPPQEMGYDLWLNACSAQWKSGAGPLPCSGTVGDHKGFVIADGFSHLEDGTMGPLPSLLMSPENKYNGYIQGVYPAFIVQPGDRFRTVVGCDHGTACYVTFRLDYMTSSGSIFNFWQWREKNDGKNYTADVDLTPLAGRSVRFILTLLATGSANGDRVRWGGPMIVRKGSAPPPTLTPLPSPSTTPTPVSSTDQWLTYANPTYGFEFKYPPQSQIVSQQVNSARINLPFVAGTNLREKYLSLTVIENPTLCQSPLATSSMVATSETVSVNGVSFLKQTGGDAGAGNFYDWVAYSTLHDNDCISMDFVLHSLNAGNFDPPVPVFDAAAESGVFLQIVQTLKWAPVTSVPTSTPASLIGPYAVVNVAANDVLNIRAGAGVSQPIVGYFSSEANDVYRTGPSVNVEGAVWVEVRRYDGLIGWVNSYYLTEYVTHEAFCADTRISPLIEQLKQSMIQSNGSLLSPIVSPVHGVNMHLWAYGPGINFTPAAAASIYTSTTVYNWGGGPSGIPDTGTFNAAVKPKYLEVFNAPNMETYCDELTKVFPLYRPWPYPNIRYYNLYKPASDQFFDFRTLLVGIEYINGQPYLYGMVTIIWEP
jgi:hypothetical protein